MIWSDLQSENKEKLGNREGGVNDTSVSGHSHEREHELRSRWVGAKWEKMMNSIASVSHPHKGILDLIRYIIITLRRESSGLQMVLAAIGMKCAQVIAQY